MINDEVLKIVDLNQFAFVANGLVKKCSKGHDFSCAFWNTPSCDKHEYMKLPQ